MSTENRLSVHNTKSFFLGFEKKTLVIEENLEKYIVRYMNLQ